jgi:multiple sugar transport system ATP-binding protein
MRKPKRLEDSSARAALTEEEVCHGNGHLRRRGQEVRRGNRVNDLSLLVRDGEFLVLVGPSGCGKTTALRMLAGLEEQTSGDIYIGERLVHDVPPKDRDIAMVFQNYALYPHMSVHDNIAFGLKLRGTAKAEIEHRVQNVAQILGLDQLLRRKPKELSGGQRQRVALGRAIAREPGLPHGRAAVEPRREAADPDARRAAEDPPAPRQDDDLRDARPGRGHDHGRPHRGDEGRAAAAGRYAAGAARPSGEPFRRRVHRRAGDELFPARAAGLAADTGFVQVPLNGHRERLEGKEVIIGMRPEDIHDLARTSPEGKLPVEATVEVVEYLGNELQLHLNAAGRAFVARVSTDTQTVPGATMQVGFDLRKLHFFDSATEEAIR